MRYQWNAKETQLLPVQYKFLKLLRCLPNSAFEQTRCLLGYGLLELYDFLLVVCCNFVCLVHFVQSHSFSCTFDLLFLVEVFS